MSFARGPPNMILTNFDEFNVFCRMLINNYSDQRISSSDFLKLGGSKFSIQSEYSLTCNLGRIIRGVIVQRLPTS